MGLDELNSTAQALMRIRAQLARLSAEEKALTDKLKGAMLDAGTETLTGDGWKASWKNVHSNRFDAKAFRAEHPDLAAQYMRQATATRFLLQV